MKGFALKLLDAETIPKATADRLIAGAISENEDPVYFANHFNVSIAIFGKDLRTPMQIIQGACSRSTLGMRMSSRSDGEGIPKPHFDAVILSERS